MGLSPAMAIDTTKPGAKTKPPVRKSGAMTGDSSGISSKGTTDGGSGIMQTGGGLGGAQSANQNTGGTSTVGTTSNNTPPTRIKPLPPAQGGPLGWADEKAFAPCGQSCMQNRAAQGIALSSVYNLAVLDHLMSIDFKSDPDQAKKDALEILGGFCKLSKPQPDADADEVKQCRDTYVVIQKEYLRKLRKAEAQNKANAAKFSSQIVLPNGQLGPEQATAFERYRDPSEPAKRAQVPYVLTFEDLEKQYQKIRTLSSPEYANWIDRAKRGGPARDDLIVEPSRDDFVRFKQIPRDPKNPMGEKLTVVIKKPNGDAEIDEPAYLAAMAEYKKHQKNIQAQLEHLLKDPSDTFTNNYKASMVPKTSVTKLETKTSAKQKEIFNKARLSVVGVANQALVKTGAVGVSEVSYLPPNPPTQAPAQKTNRAPSGTTAPPAPVVSMPFTLTPPTQTSLSGGLTSSLKSQVTDNSRDKAQVAQPKPTRQNEGTFHDIGWEPNELQQAIDAIIVPDPPQP